MYGWSAQKMATRMSRRFFVACFEANELFYSSSHCVIDVLASEDKQLSVAE